MIFRAINHLSLSALIGFFACLFSIEAYAGQKQNEEFFMSRARYAAHAACARKSAPKTARYESCRKEQMRAAKRIVDINRRANSEKVLKTSISCMQMVQVLPIKLRVQGMLWVERCIRKKI